MRQHRKHALMHAPERRARNEAIKSLKPKGELAQRQRALAAEPSFLQSLQIFRRVVLRAVDDTQIFPPADFERGLNQTLVAACDERLRLDHHPLAAACGQILPPANGLIASIRIVE